MATELQITSYRNILTVLSNFKTALTALENQAKLLLSVSSTQGAWSASTSPSIEMLTMNRLLIAPINDKALVGFALPIVGKSGKKDEWYRLIKNKVMKGVFPVNFVNDAYEKSTGNVCTDKRRGAGWVQTQGGTYCQRSRYDKTGDRTRGAKILRWIEGQKARLSYVLNDVVRYGDMLEMELTRVRLPMPEKFRAWLMDIRDTAVAAAGESSGSPTYYINVYRIFTLTTFEGELAKDYNVIKKTIDAQIAELERVASLPPVVLAPVKPNITVQPTDPIPGPRAPEWGIEQPDSAPNIKQTLQPVILKTPTQVKTEFTTQDKTESAAQAKSEVVDSGNAKKETGVIIPAAIILTLLKLM